MKVVSCRPCCPLSPNHPAVDSWRWPWDLWQHWLCPLMMEILRAALCHRWTHTHLISKRKIWVESGMFNGSLFVFIYTQVHALNILRALYRDTRLGGEHCAVCVRGHASCYPGFHFSCLGRECTLLLNWIEFYTKGWFFRHGWPQNMYLEVPSSTIMPFY